MALIKICGITNKQDALAAAGLGVDMLGFVFYKKSRRYVTPHAARDIINELPPGIERIGVFVDEEREGVLSIADEALLTALQFHGDESPSFCEGFRPSYKVIKAFRIRDKNGLKKVNDYNTDFYLFDAYKPDTIGGTGETFDWNILKDFEVLKPFIIAGGLRPDNVLAVIKEVAPYGVDVSTGVENSPGRKDIMLMKRFVENVRVVG